MSKHDSCPYLFGKDGKYFCRLNSEFGYSKRSSLVCPSGVDERNNCADLGTAREGQPRAQLDPDRHTGSSTA